MSDTELLPKSKPGAVQRLEVFTGSGRRRIWTTEQKARIIAESYGGGEPVSAVARRHGLTPQQLFGWRREARQPTEAEAGTSGAAFAPVVVEAAPPCTSPPSDPIAAGAGAPAMIEIVIGTITARIRPGIDAATLATVLRAMRSMA